MMKQLMNAEAPCIPSLRPQGFWELCGSGLVLQVLL